MSVEDLKGKPFGWFSIMNGGKTKAVVAMLELFHHAGKNFVAYNSHFNTRDGINQLVVDGREGYPAKTVSGFPEIIGDLESRMEKIHSRKIADQGENGRIIINGAKHWKYREISAVVIDEINLFCLDEKGAKEAIKFIFWCRKRGITLGVSGLEYDFRHRPFGHVRAIFPYVRTHHLNPVCKSLIKGNNCGDDASHSQRLWSLEFVDEVNIGELSGEMSLYDFDDKKGNHIIGKYVSAPYFDKTKRIEEAEDGRVVYVPVCNNCAILPFKDEVDKLYAAIRDGRGIRQEDLSGIVGNETLSKVISNFLLEEDWARTNDQGLYVPTRYFRNDIGTFSAEPKPELIE